MSHKPFIQGAWPPPGPTNDPNPNTPTTSPTQPRVLLHQRYDPNHAIWIADFVAGAGNQDGFAPGTHYSMSSATQFSGVG